MTYIPTVFIDGPIAGRWWDTNPESHMFLWRDGTRYNLYRTSLFGVELRIASESEEWTTEAALNAIEVLFKSEHARIMKGVTHL